MLRSNLQWMHVNQLPTFSLKILKSSHQRCSVKKGVLRNFAKFTGKPLCQSLFFNKLAEHLRTTASEYSRLQNLQATFLNQRRDNKQLELWTIQKSLCKDYYPKYVTKKLSILLFFFPKIFSRGVL